MNMYDILRKKRDKGHLEQGEFDFWLKGSLKGEIPDYQSAALLMACFIHGLNKEETAALTLAMLNSGKVLDLSSIPGIKADKHSTGGVGDKTSLVIAPIIAAAGIYMAKMSGRGLGHTGGTLDKLESIPGFNTALSTEEFLGGLRENGLVIAAQTRELVPGDKLLYALRDVTATVDSLPLIAASIMSKKIAAGADIIVLDVKYGSGAFMKSLKDAKKLAKTMVDTGNSLGKKTYAVITSMEEPLGQFIGNSLEVKEALAVLKGQKADDNFRNLCLALAGEIIFRSQLAKSRKKAIELAESLLQSKAAYEKFILLVKTQGGDLKALDNPEYLPSALYKADFISPKGGYLYALDAEALGFISLDLGAGRRKKEDTLDYGAGLKLWHKTGDRLKKGEIIATLYSNSQNKLAPALEALSRAVKINSQPPVQKPLIAGYVDYKGFKKHI